MIKNIVIALFVCCSLLSCTPKQKDTHVKGTVQLITIPQMETLLDNKEVQLIDVRTPEEYAQGHIKGAVNINYKDDDFSTLITKVDTSKPVIVYCARGGRSRQSAKLMKNAGFKKIYDLEGGITAWKMEQKEIVKN
ncbi:rhodanese-like domain-containing protein [Aquimarina rhabdastrellae]